MTDIRSFVRRSNFLPISLSVVLSFTLVALITYSASTISTNISTDGTLTVNGNSTFGDAATDVNLFTGTLQASTTALFTTGITTYGNSTFGDAATDVNLFTGTLQASTTALFTVGLRLYDPLVASTTDAHILINGFATTSASNGDISTEGTVIAETSLGVASTSPYVALGVTGTTTSSAGMVIGANGTGIVQLLHGTCTVDLPTIGTSEIGVANCTATGVTTADKVFVTPQRLETWIVFHGASSTAANTIQVAAFNATSTETNPAQQTWSWMAIK